MEVRGQIGEMRCRWAARGQKYLRGRARAWRPTRHGRVRVAPASFHAAFKRRLWDARRPAGCEDALSTHSADEAERHSGYYGAISRDCGKGVKSDKRLLDFEHLDRDSSHHPARGWRHEDLKKVGTRCVFTRIVVAV